MALEHWNDTCRLMKKADEMAASGNGKGNEQELY